MTWTYAGCIGDAGQAALRVVAERSEAAGRIGDFCQQVRIGAVLVGECGHLAERIGDADKPEARICSLPSSDL